jgi:capsular exopolysaccharide synthesis family protein
MRSRGTLGVVRRRWRWVAALTALGLLAALAWSMASATTYRATASVFFSLEYGDSASELVQGSTYTQNQVASFARLVTTPAVLQPAIDELDLDIRPDELARRIEASSPIDTVIIEVSVTDPSPDLSAQIADAVIDSLSHVVEEVAPQNAAGNPTVRATTVAPAEVPRSPASPDIPLNLLAGLVAGLLLGLAAAFVRDVLDNRVRDADVAAEITALPVVGVIPARTRRTAATVVVETDPQSPHAETFRHLRTNLQFLGVPSRAPGGSRTDVQVVTVTSSLAAEGKSTVAANLAAALAETGVRVLLVDADLRRPALAALLGAEGSVGLTDVLIGRADAADVVQEWGSHGLRFLASGPVPPNPSELLASPAMSALLGQLRQEYEYVVLDTAPLLPVADATILSRLVDGTLVLANVTRVRRTHLADSLRSLEQVGGRVLGLVLNQVLRNDETYSYERREDGVTAPEPAMRAVATPSDVRPPTTTSGAMPPVPPPSEVRRPDIDPDDAAMAAAVPACSAAPDGAAAETRQSGTERQRK